MSKTDINNSALNVECSQVRAAALRREMITFRVSGCVPLHIDNTDDVFG